jgi:hypothetical protein
MEIADQLARDDALFKATQWQVVDTTDRASGRGRKGRCETITAAARAHS